MADEQRTPSTIEQIVSDALASVRSSARSSMEQQAEMSQGDLWRQFAGLSLMLGPLGLGPRGMGSMSRLVGIPDAPAGAAPSITGGSDSQWLTYGPNSAEDLAHRFFLRRPVVPSANQFYGPVELPANANSPRVPLGPPRSFRVIEGGPSGGQ